MAIDLTELSTIANKANILSNLILVSPGQRVGYQPQNIENKTGKVTIPPRRILFHYEGEQTVSMDSEITDHYVEKNFAVQDHISLMPEMVSTHGFIGELNDVPPERLRLLKIAADKLTPVGGYFPQLSETALRAYQQAVFAYQNTRDTLNNLVEAVDTLGGFSNSLGVLGDNAAGNEIDSTQNLQQIYFALFHGYWRERRLFTVQTPWGIFKDMAIKNVRAIQGDDNDVITDFEITFKAIRFTDSVTAVVDVNKKSERLASQSAPKTFLGNSVPKESPTIFDEILQPVLQDGGLI